MKNNIKNTFPSESSCLNHLEKLRWNGIVTSPFAENSKVYYCKNGRYKCRETGKYFTVKTNTIFHNSKISLQSWFTAIWIVAYMKNGISSVELAHELGVTQKTAWYMLQKIKNHFGLKNKLRKKIMEAGTQSIEDITVILNDDRLKLTDWLNLLKR